MAASFSTKPAGGVGRHRVEAAQLLLSQRQGENLGEDQKPEIGGDVADHRRMIAVRIAIDCLLHIQIARQLHHVVWRQTRSGLPIYRRCAADSARR